MGQYIGHATTTVSGKRAVGVRWEKGVTWGIVHGFLCFRGSATTDAVMSSRTVASIFIVVASWLYVAAVAVTHMASTCPGQASLEKKHLYKSHSLVAIPSVYALVLSHNKAFTSFSTRDARMAQQASTYAKRNAEHDKRQGWLDLNTIPNVTLRRNTEKNQKRKLRNSHNA